jgi:tetratricopeptide (TPR) repeat protein
MLLDDQGQHAKAEPLYLHAVEISERIPGAEDPGLATYLNNLAILYYEMGRYALAEPRFLRSLALLELALGPNHPTVAFSLASLAVLYRVTNRSRQAEQCQARADAIRGLQA